MTYAQAEEAGGFLAHRIAIAPRVAVVLGSGLQGLAEEISGRVEIATAEIPHWPRPTVAGHAGKLTVGRLDNKTVAVLSGRPHLYEGYSAGEVVFPIRVLPLLGVRTLVLTNAAGGVNLALRRGQLVLIADHINLQGVNPLLGQPDGSFGPQFTDLSEVYPRALRDLARECGREIGLDLAEGVYAALPGPSYETPAEIRYLRTIGADMVGMSTVPEAIAAAQRGLPVLGISCISNMAAGILPQKITHAEVLETGAQVRGALTALLKKVIPRL